MVTLRSLQKRRGRKNNRSKRIRTQRIKGGKSLNRASAKKLNTTKRTHKKKPKKKKTKGKERRYGGEPTWEPFTYLKKPKAYFRDKYVHRICVPLEHGVDKDNERLLTGTGSYGVFIKKVEFTDRTYYTLNTSTGLKLSYKQIHEAYDVLIKILIELQFRNLYTRPNAESHDTIGAFLKLLNNQKTYGKKITVEGTGGRGDGPRAAPEEEVAEERKAIQWTGRKRDCYIRVDDINCLCYVINHINKPENVLIRDDIIKKLNKKWENDDEQDLFNIIKFGPNF